MTKPFCMKCAEEQFGPEAVAKIKQDVADAPPFTPEQRSALQALFRTAPHSSPAERPAKTCGH